MNDYQLTSELFTIPNKEAKTILYFPLAGLVIEANNSLVNLLFHFEEKDLGNLTSEENQQFNYLLEKGIITKKNNVQPIGPEKAKDLPYKLTLFPTNDCNLECTYCYASQGRSKRLVMSWEIVESAVEFYINLMKQENRTIFNLELHGGGEPFYEWKLVQNMIEYIEKACYSNNLKLESVSSTNGILNSSQLEWITKHFSFILVSFEGLPDIQNLQRPFANQKPTFQVVNETIKYFDQQDFPYGIRVTVTNRNENLLKETIDFVSEHYKTKQIFLEPMRACGTNKSLKEVNFRNFMENFIKLEAYANQKGIKIRYSGAEYENCTANFCYVGTSQFAITPEGFLTNCWEVTDKEHPLADIFIFGELLKGGKLYIDNDKYRNLQSLSVRNFKYCQNCFAKWHCAGDCIARLYNNGIENSRGDERCATNREIIAHRLLQTLK